MKCTVPHHHPAWSICVLQGHMPVNTMEGRMGTTSGSLNLAGGLICNSTQDAILLDLLLRLGVGVVSGISSWSFFFFFLYLNLMILTQQVREPMRGFCQMQENPAWLCLTIRYGLWSWGHKMTTGWVSKPNHWTMVEDTWDRITKCPTL